MKGHNEFLDVPAGLLLREGTEDAVAGILASALLAIGKDKVTRNPVHTHEMNQVYVYKENLSFVTSGSM